ncbi:MAG: hypothetical protein H0X46_09505, partial [Bacteroidetes bacterium]|nr:hypothetical protein [Bacteroidota bacterium]
MKLPQIFSAMIHEFLHLNHQTETPLSYNPDPQTFRPNPSKYPYNLNPKKTTSLRPVALPTVVWDDKDRKLPDPGSIKLEKGSADKIAAFDKNKSRDVTVFKHVLSRVTGVFLGVGLLRESVIDLAKLGLLPATIALMPLHYTFKFINWAAYRKTSDVNPETIKWNKA